MHKLLLISVLALVPLAAGATARSADDTFSPEKGLDLSQSFAAQRDAIFAALADGKTYAEIGAGDRQKVKQSLDRISGLLGDAQSVEQLSDSTRVEVFNEQELVNTLLTRAREDSRLVCTREKKVGSHRATTNCLTVAERRRLREETENALISNRGYKLPVSNWRSPMRILVIEDNSDIAANLGDYLEDRGHTVDFAADGVTGLHLAVVHDFDAIVLDLNLPGMDGIEVCRKLRNEARKQTPVLMLTARDSLENKLAGFDSGADDYLIKPFALQEVEVRLNALSRRGKGVQTRVLNTGDLEYNLDTLEVRREGRLLQLNPTALKILQALMEASPAVVTRQELETRVWGEELPDSDSLRVHIHGLRAVVDKPFPVPYIQTRHGIGYRIAAPDGSN